MICLLDLATAPAAGGPGRAAVDLVAAPAAGWPGRAAAELAEGQRVHTGPPWNEEWIHLHSRNSSYQKVGVWFHIVDNSTHLFIDDDVQLSSLSEFAYHEMMAYVPLATALCSAPGGPGAAAGLRVFLLGAGDGALAQRILRAVLVSHAVQVEIDELVVNLSRRFLPMLQPDADTSRYSLVIGDGIEFARRAAGGREAGTFDLAILDTPARKPELFSPELYRDVAAMLRPGGVLAQNMGPISAEVQIRRHVAQMTRAFPRVVAFHFGWPDHESPYLAVLAGDCMLPRQQTSDCARRLLQPPGLLGPPLRYYSVEMHEAVFVLPAGLADLGRLPARCGGGGAVESPAPLEATAAAASHALHAQAEAEASTRELARRATPEQRVRLGPPWHENWLQLFDHHSGLQTVRVMHNMEDLSTYLIVGGRVQLSSLFSYPAHEMLAYVPLAATLCTVASAGRTARDLQVLVLGAGDGGLVQRLLRHPVVGRVVQVEIDELVLRVAHDFFPKFQPIDDGRAMRHHLVIGDAFEFAQQRAKQGQGSEFDLIIADGPNMLWQNRTQDPYQSLAALLRPGGLLALGLGSADDESFVRQNLGMVSRGFPRVVPFQFNRPDYVPSPYLAALAGNAELRCPRRLDCAKRLLRPGPSGPPLRYYSPGVHQVAFTLPAAHMDLAEAPEVCSGDSGRGREAARPTAPASQARVPAMPPLQGVEASPAQGRATPVGSPPQRSSEEVPAASGPGASLACTVGGGTEAPGGLRALANNSSSAAAEEKYDTRAFLGAPADVEVELLKHTRGWLQGAPYSARYPETTILLELLSLLLGIGLLVAAYPDERRAGARVHGTGAAEAADPREAEPGLTNSGESVIACDTEKLGNLNVDVYARAAWAGRLEEPVRKWASVDASRTALLSQDEQLTYGQLWDRAAGMAAALETWLREPGAGPLVGLLASRGAGMVVGMLGILRAGAGYVPLEPSLPVERLRFMLRDADAAGLAYESQWGALAQGLPAAFALAIGSGRPAASTAGATEGPSPGTADSTAVVLYTSGSTGKPKGVRISHRAATVGGGWHSSAGRLWLKPVDRVLILTSFSFYDHLTEIHGALSVGAMLLLAPPDAMRDFSALSKFVAEQGPSAVHWVPSVLQAYLSVYGGIPSATVALSSGEPMPASLARAFLTAGFAEGARYINLYGSTEVGNATAYEVAESNRGVWEAHPAVPAGLPLDCQALLVGADGAVRRQVGEEAELLVAGAGLADGYVNLRELTAEAFVAHPVHAGRRAFRTGDLAEWLAEGGLRVLGRKDGQVKVRGLRVELGEVEEALRGVAGVLDAAAVSREQRIVGYVTLRAAGAGLTPTGLLSSLKESMLPAYMRPAEVVILEGDFPRSEGSRKIDKRQLPAPAGVEPLSDSLSLMLRSARGRLRASEAYQGNIYFLCQVLVVLTHAYDHNPEDMVMVGPAACVHASENPVVQWFHHHDAVAPDLCALLVMSAVADMHLLESDRRELLRSAAFFLVFGTLADAIGVLLTSILSTLGGAQPYEMWMVNHLHGPGKLSRRSYECNYYIGTWYFKLRAGLALVTWCFSPVLRPARRPGTGVSATIGHLATLLGWALLFAGWAAASFALAAAALGCWALQGGRLCLMGSEWPAAAPTVALLALHAGRRQRCSSYGSLWAAVSTEVSHLMGLEDVWLISYFVLPILFGGLRFPAPLLRWKRGHSFGRNSLATTVPASAVHLLLILAYIVGVSVLDPATYDSDALLMHKPGLLPPRYNTGWGFTSSACYLCTVYLGLPVLVALLFLAVPAVESRASLVGLTGSMVCYALHVPILNFQQSFNWINSSFWATTLLSIATSALMMQLRFPEGLLSPAWGVTGVGRSTAWGRPVHGRHKYGVQPWAPGVGAGVRCYASGPVLTGGPLLHASFVPQLFCPPTWRLGLSVICSHAGSLGFWAASGRVLWRGLSPDGAPEGHGAGPGSSGRPHSGG